jgi:hypothetical protein
MNDYKKQRSSVWRVPPQPGVRAERIAPLVLKCGLFGFLVVYFYEAAVTFITYPPAHNWPFLLWLIRNSIFLFIHEGGHVLFLPLGHVLYALGGSFWQVMFPFLSFLIGAYRRSEVIAPFALFWTGANMLDVSLYMRDAPRRILPLLGRRKEGHDWHFLFNEFGLMDSAETIADLVYYIGALICVGAIVVGVVLAVRRFLQIEESVTSTPRLPIP